MSTRWVVCDQPARQEAPVPRWPGRLALLRRGSPVPALPDAEVTGAPALEARVLDIDHGFRGVGTDPLMQITTRWIEASFPASSEPTAGERQD